MKKLGLYIHIPFCVKKCNYCDFLSYEMKVSDEKTEKEYVEALKTEIKEYGALYGSEYVIDSVFVGGGTPSLINEALIADLIYAVKAAFNIEEDAEITIESNPGTIEEKKLEAYLKCGINRLSIGVQSLNDNCLKLLGRIHSAEEFYKNYAIARQIGFSNINIDLMFSIPGQDMNILRETVEKVIKMSPEHISFYSLQIEEGTPFYQMIKRGDINQNSDEEDRKMYHNCIKMLKENNYIHYEISNAAKADFECRHNLKYWSFDDYLGVGLAAHSFMNGIRFSNTKDIKKYVYNIKKGQSIVEWKHINSKEDNVSEYIFTGLRKIKGIDLNDFEKMFGDSIENIYKDNWHKINSFIESKHLFKDEYNLKINENGLDISNKIMAEFL